MTALILQWCA